MHPSRRRFLQLSAGAASLLLAHNVLRQVPNAQAAAPKANRKAAPKRILVLGGTGFLGPAIVQAAQARGHKITLFNRGKTRPGLFPDVEKRQGDRDPTKGDGLKTLETGEWDAVIDDSGYVPRVVGASATLLAKRVQQYIFISSISAYQDPPPVGGDENAPLATMKDPTIEVMGDQFENYGPLKALSEQAVAKALPDRTTIVRPGFIVGPDDPTGRFTYWVARFDRGGDVAVPGTPNDPVQFIDVRDLAQWLVHLVEQRTFGTFTATGPRTRLTWGRAVKAFRAATKTPNTPVWIPTAFVAADPNIGFPIWVPAEGDSKGFHTWNISRALKAGLTFRTVDVTVKDTLAWYRSQKKLENEQQAAVAADPKSVAATDKARTKLALDEATEAAFLKAWKANPPTKK